MKVKVNTRTLPVADTLPTEFLLLIGEICVAWSLQERALRQTVFAMLGLSEARGRLAIRTPRSREMVEMIADLALTFGFTIDLEGLRLLDELESRRNKVVHGAWFAEPDGTYILEDINGKVPIEGGQGFKLNKRIVPAGVPITVETLRDLLGAIRKTTLNTYDVAEAIKKRMTASSSAAEANKPQS